MKLGFQDRFQVPLDHHLSYSVRDRRNSERPSSSRISLWYINAAHGWRKVASGTHPIPDPIEVLTQVSVEVLDSLTVNSRRPLVCLHLLIRLPHITLVNTKRPCFIHESHPLFGLLTGRSRMTAPLRSDPITGPSALLRAPPPLCPASVLRPSRLLTAWVSPFASGRQVPVFLIGACLEVTPPSCRTPVGQSAGFSQPLLAG